MTEVRLPLPGHLLREVITDQPVAVGEGAPGLRVGGPAGFVLFEGPLDEPPKSVFVGQAWSVNTA